MNIRNQFFALVLITWTMIGRAWSIEFDDFYWENRGSDQKVTSTLNEEDANEILAKIQNMVETDEKSEVRVVKSRSEKPPKNYRVVLPTPLFEKYQFDKIDKDEQGRKYFQRYLFDHLTHSTSYNNIFKILKEQALKPRETLDHAKEKIDVSGPCNGEVVYTMMLPEWGIVPHDGHSDIPSGVTLALPLNLLERDDWHISPHWEYGMFTSRSYQSESRIGVKSILSEKNKGIVEWLDHSKFDKKKIRYDSFAYRWLIKDIIHEIVFKQNLDFKGPDERGVDLGKNLKLFFASNAMRDKFILDLQSDDELNNIWKVTGEGISEAEVPYLVIDRK